jgi:hypothetical protein
MEAHAEERSQPQADAEKPLRRPTAVYLRFIRNTDLGDFYKSYNRDGLREYVSTSVSKPLHFSPTGG